MVIGSTSCKKKDSNHLKGKYKVALDFSQSGIPPTDSIMKALAMVDMEMEFVDSNKIVNTVKIGAAANSDQLIYAIKDDSITITDRNKAAITYHLRRADDEIILNNRGRVLRLTPMK